MKKEGALSSFKINMLIGGMILIVPVLVGGLVSFSLSPNLETNNDWIGFWGGYSGSLIGGFITLVVMKKTLDSNRLLQERNERQQLCNHVAKLVSDFCIEIMAYRSKWKTLYRQANGGAIDSEKAIEMGATTEKPRRILFECEMLLSHIPEAKDTIDCMRATLSDAKVTQLSVRETEQYLSELRARAKKFLSTYMATTY